ncbi:MAG TPA: hypothetical protein VFQ61_32465 [Polyangiaceae bacterium]|nr:hypothetical protein [Polyangiaceae bacterium]
MMRSRYASLCTLVLVAACGGAAANSSGTMSPEAESQPSSGEGNSDPAPAAEGSNPAGTAEASKRAEESAKAVPSSNASSESSANKPSEGGTEPEVVSEPARNVKYVVSPEGLRVEVEGVSFSPKGEAVKTAGGYTIRFKVEARAKDGKTHSLLAPESKELAFAGRVKGPDGEATRFGDKREGDRALTLGEKPVTLKRSYPGPGEKPLSAGSELELMVGLWGIGADESSRRPLNKFFRATVKLDKEKPRVVIAPPEGTSKE